jgi:hypothetical protein
MKYFYIRIAIYATSRCICYIRHLRRLEPTFVTCVCNAMSHCCLGEWIRVIVELDSGSAELAGAGGGGMKLLPSSACWSIGHGGSPA